jgi:hypothetical protein
MRFLALANMSRSWITEGNSSQSSSTEGGYVTRFLVLYIPAIKVGEAGSMPDEKMLSDDGKVQRGIRKGRRFNWRSTVSTDVKRPA